MNDLHEHLQKAGCIWTYDHTSIIDNKSLVPHTIGYKTNDQEQIAIAVIAVRAQHIQHDETLLPSIQKMYDAQYIVVQDSYGIYWHEGQTLNLIPTPLIQNRCSIFTKESNIMFIYSKMYWFMHHLNLTQKEIREAYICWNLLALYRHHKQLPWSTLSDEKYIKKLWRKAQATYALFLEHSEKYFKPSLISTFIHCFSVMDLQSTAHAKVLYLFLRQPNEPYPNVAESYLEKLLDYQQLFGNVLLYNNLSVPLYVTLATKPLDHLYIYEQNKDHIAQIQLLLYVIQYKTTTFISQFNRSIEKFDWIIHATACDVPSIHTLLDAYCKMLYPMGQLIFLHHETTNDPIHPKLQLIQKQTFTVNEQTISIGHYQLKEDA